MGRLARIVINGITGVGLIDGLASIIMPPERPSHSAASDVSIQEAWARDALAIRGDWQSVGNDIRTSMDRLSGEVVNG